MELREQLDAYIESMFAQEDDGLKHIQEQAKTNGLPEISLLPFEGRLLQMLVEMVNAKKIVEIGTLAGYSGTWLARALPADGKLITIEVSSKHAKVAQANFEAVGVAERVEIRQGQARDLLRKLAHEAPFDLVFIDADKDSYPFYLEWAVEHLRVGGLVVAHNALRHGNIIAPKNDLDEAMVTYNKQIADHPRLSSFIIGVGDGMAVSLKKY